MPLSHDQKERIKDTIVTYIALIPVSMFGDFYRIQNGLLQQLEEIFGLKHQKNKYPHEFYNYYIPNEEQMKYLKAMQTYIQEFKEMNSELEPEFTNFVIDLIQDSIDELDDIMNKINADRYSTLDIRYQHNQKYLLTKVKGDARTDFPFFMAVGDSFGADISQAFGGFYSEFFYIQNESEASGIWTKDELRLFFMNPYVRKIIEKGFVDHTKESPQFTYFSAFFQIMRLGNENALDLVKLLTIDNALELFKQGAIKIVHLHTFSSKPELWKPYLRALTHTQIRDILGSSLSYDDFFNNPYDLIRLHRIIERFQDISFTPPDFSFLIVDVSLFSKEKRLRFNETQIEKAMEYMLDEKIKELVNYRGIKIFQFILESFEKNGDELTREIMANLTKEPAFSLIKKGILDFSNFSSKNKEEILAKLNVFSKFHEEINYIIDNKILTTEDFNWQFYPDLSSGILLATENSAIQFLLINKLIMMNNYSKSEVVFFEKLVEALQKMPDIMFEKIKALEFDFYNSIISKLRNNEAEDAILYLISTPWILISELENAIYDNSKNLFGISNYNYSTLAHNLIKLSNYTKNYLEKSSLEDLDQIFATNPEIAEKLFLGKEKNIHNSDSKGNNFLQQAILQRKNHLIPLFLNLKIDHTHVNQNGESALEMLDLRILNDLPKSFPVEKRNELILEKKKGMPESEKRRMERMKKEALIVLPEIEYEKSQSQKEKAANSNPPQSSQDFHELSIFSKASNNKSTSEILNEWNEELLAELEKQQKK